jgi:hypothetical protein
MDRLRATGGVPGERALDELPPIETRRDEAKPLELPSGWKELAGLEIGKPSTRTAILSELPLLLGRSVLDREVAHRAVHAVIMGVAAGRWGKDGAPVVTTDRVLSAIDRIDSVIAELDRIDPKFVESYERFRLLAKRALDHSGPNGLFGPSSIYGPLDNHPSNPSSLFPNFEMFNLVSEWVKQPAPLSPGNTDLLKRMGEHQYELLPGNALPFVGPPSELLWALGAHGHNGAMAFKKHVEGGAWRDRFGAEVTKVGASGREQPLYEIYGEAYAAANTSKDAFFGVEGTAKRGDKDAYRFESKEQQWITIGCSQVTPGRRFAVTLYRIDGEQRTEIARSEGLSGPAGIHTKVPPGKYEAVVEQLARDHRVPELLEHPVGKRLGPALIEYREAWGKAFPEAVDWMSERDPERYRLYVSGTGPTEDAAFAPPERSAIREALASSRQNERTLERTVETLEATVRTLEGFDQTIRLTTLPAVYSFFTFWGVLPLVRPADDRSDPSKADDPLIERYMRSVSRLDHLFYGGKLAQWIETMMPSALAPLKLADANLRAIGLPGLALPRTVANNADR